MTSLYGSLVRARTLLFANAAVLVRLVKESACKQGSVLEVVIVISVDLSH